MTVHLPADHCRDCLDLLAEHSQETQGLSDAATHLAVGMLYGGGPCDHVDYTDSDLADAYRWMLARTLRQRDLFSTALQAVARNDRTGIYRIDEPRPDGVCPPPGETHLTPRELAERALRRVHGHVPSV